MVQIIVHRYPQTTCLVFSTILVIFCTDSTQFLNYLRYLDQQQIYAGHTIRLGAEPVYSHDILGCFVW